MTKNEINYSWLAVENWLKTEATKAYKNERPYGYGDLNKNLKQPGVYAIYFVKTKQVYIGSSTHLYKERLKHLLELKEGIHINCNLQKAFDDSGLNAIMFIYIITANKEEAFNNEQKLLDDYWGNPKLLNIVKNYKKFERDIKDRSNDLNKLLESAKIRYEDSYMLPKKENSIDTSVTINSNFQPFKLIEQLSENMMTDDNKVNKPTQGIIMYSDGAARPTNPGKNAWGVHGYLYENEEPKKGSGNQTHILTASGYIPKVAKLKDGFTEVKPLQYFDFFGSSLLINSNNVAELDATKNALLKAAEFDVTVVNIYTDSEYVRRGVEEWHPGWIKRNWIRNDGNPVPNAEHWKSLLTALNVLKDKGVVVKINWFQI